MHYALHSLVFPHPRQLLAEDLLVRIRDIGYHAVELVPIDYAGEDVARLRTLCRRVGLQLLVGWSLEAAHHLADPQRTAAGLRQMKHIVTVAEQLEAPLVAGVNYAGCGAVTGAPPTEEELSRAASAVAEVCDFAGRAGVTVCLEPATREDSHLVNTVSQGLEFCRRVNRPNAALLLDTFQMLREERSLGGAIAEARGSIGYFHVSESHRGTPGTGTVPWDEVGRSLRAVGYDGWVGVEAFFDTAALVASRAKVWRQMESDPLTLARKAMDHLRALFA
jgi:D-psicose/D-tagatose/L-ribulose 3-epimerase